ncbi:BrnA antitoxin family protein [Duganella sp. FT3S]|uniref:BrnA antitoxin family protein n=1 Tax=Rugamonas fusca TaxID=2758568 RepID=A0A7W2EH46_9BURK|nr:BrnA antitoxin family protein [Rugamonas fusca]MBA5605786.1 BrnA antitoxin family protein [Rugamonas fusca]
MNEATSRKHWTELADEEIDLSDIPEVTEASAKHGTMREALIQKNTLLIDLDVYDWFRRQGPDYEWRINQLLRDYMESTSRAHPG